MEYRSTHRLVFFYLLLGSVAVLAFFLFLPFFITITMAIALAVVSQPLYQAILRIVRQQKPIAVALTMLAVGIVILAPLSLMTMQVVYEATDLYDRISESDAINGNFLPVVESTIEGYVRPYIPSFDINLSSTSRQMLSWISAHLGTFFANTVQVLLHFFLGIIAFYYILKDGQSFLQSLITVSPLPNTHDRQILTRLGIAINSIVKGSLLIAILQGVTSGIGFAIFNVPSAALWGSLAAIGALIPGVGTAIVIAPAVLYLFITGQTGFAIGLIIWGATAVGLIDNILGPVLVGRGVRIHPLFILFAVIGGIQFFGPLGFILGPLVLSLLFALIDIYSMMLSTEKKK